jgi:hypothetical protein
MGLFEEKPYIGANSSRAMQAKHEQQLPSTLVSSASYGPSKTFVDSRPEKQEDLAQSRMEVTKDEEKGNAFDELEDDETTFDNFFSGVEIV